MHAVRPDVCVFVDNCYGEFVEELSLTAVGVDLMAGIPSSRTQEVHWRRREGTSPAGRST